MNNFVGERTDPVLFIRKVLRARPLSFLRHNCQEDLLFYRRSKRISRNRDVRKPADFKDSPPQRFLGRINLDMVEKWLSRMKGPMVLLCKVIDDA